ncbi:MAG: DUF4268 domain-containing protein [Longimicrobiaceae bacterium]
MYLINRTTNRIEPLQRRTFSELGLRERSNLQEWIANHPVALGEEMLVIQKEFSGFANTAERLDLLALDKRGNLVIIENKLDDSGRDVTWQALKYASYCSSLSKEQIRSIFQQYLDQHAPGSSAADRLAEFFQAEYEELELNPGVSQRLVLIAAHFRKEVTSTVLWLMNYKLQVQCFEATVYSLADELFLSLEQIIPLRGAEEYIVGMAEKTQEDAVRQKEIPHRHRVRREFWAYLLEQMNRETDLFRNISAGTDSWIGTGSGAGGIAFNMVATRNESRVEVYINRERWENELIFDSLAARSAELEQAMGMPIHWFRNDEAKGCRIAVVGEGNLYDRERWPEMASFLIPTMVRFVGAVREPLLEAVRMVHAR